MKELIEVMVKAIVDEPGEVNIQEVVGERTTIFELRVAKDDVGKVIGKRGRTAGALRTILNAVSTKQGKKSQLEIIE